MAPRKKLSQCAQARWARRMVASGRCRICGKPRERYRSLCNAHQAISTAYMRRWRKARAQIVAEVAADPTKELIT